MTLLISSVGLVAPNETDWAVDSVDFLQTPAVIAHINQCEQDAKSWLLPLFKSPLLNDPYAKVSVIKQLLFLLEQGFNKAKEEVSNDSNIIARAEEGWIAILDVTMPILPTELIEHISFNVYSHQLSEEVKFICLHSRHDTYPLLSLMRFDLLNELKAYVQAGKTDLMDFVEPYMLNIAMPYYWIKVQSAAV